MSDERVDKSGNTPEGPDGKSAFERPLECCECQKPASVRYTEIADGVVARAALCADCPFLERHLGSYLQADTSPGVSPDKKGLVCGNCGTSLAAVRTGSLLGCSHCYGIFQEVVFKELLVRNKIARRQASARGVPLHTGRGLGERIELSPGLKLIELNEALSDTLTLEDYEQAAWLRDQIKKLTEEPHASR